MTDRLLINWLVIFIGLPLLSATVLALYLIARRKNHPSRRFFGASALVLGVPAFLTFLYFAVLVLVIMAGGGLRYAVPAG